MDTQLFSLHQEHVCAIRKARENPMRLALEKLLEGVTNPNERTRIRYEFRTANQYWGF